VRFATHYFVSNIKDCYLQTFLYLHQNCGDAADGRLISRPSLPRVPTKKKSHPASKLVPLDPSNNHRSAIIVTGNNDTAIISCAAAVYTLTCFPIYKTSQPAHLSTPLSTNLPTYRPPYLPSSLPSSYLSTSLPTYLPASTATPHPPHHSCPPS
jgi:hypothetical protein